MDIKISKFAIVWKSIFGGKEAVFDYLLDKANTAIALIPGATKDRLRKVYKVVVEIRERIDALSWLVPGRWIPYYAGVMRCIDSLIDSLEDGQVSRDEIVQTVDSFQRAYALWRAEDVDFEG